MPGAVPMNEVETRVLERVRASFPVSARPFDVLAREMGRSEGEVLAVTRTLRATGALGRLGATFDAHRLGYHSTLAAVSVEEDRAEEVAALIGEYPGVTHVYEREDRYNLWFALLTPSQARTRAVLDDLAERAGVSDVLELPAIRVFKVTAEPGAGGESDVVSAAPAEHQPALTREEKALARLVQADLPLTEHPFQALAKTIEECGYDVDEQWVVDTILGWAQTRLIRRFAASGRPAPAGANAVTVWSVPEEQVEDAGRSIAGCAAVSHCYQRPAAFGDAPAIYAMMHAPNRASIDECVASVVAATGLPAPRMLYAVREFKRTSMTYFAEGE